MKILQLYVAVLYIVEMIFSLYVFIRFIPYFSDKRKYGFLPVFTFTAWVFLACYSIMSLAGLILRLLAVAGYEEAATLRTWGLVFFAVTHTGCAAAMGTLAVITFRKRNDLYIKIKKKE